MKDLDKCSIEELVMMKTKLNVAWDCCYSIGAYSICDDISCRIGMISEFIEEKSDEL